jgi:hypothetical protein
VCIEEGGGQRLHKQVVNTLSKNGFIKPFRQKWRLTPKGELAIKFHAEKDAFYASEKGHSEQEPTGS